jgi:uncharacterized membrane protein
MRRRWPASQLIVLAYADEHRAAEVLATLHRLRTGSLINASSAATVVRATDWHVLVRYGTDLGASDDTVAEFWRPLIASLFILPAAPSDRTALARYRLNTQFVEDVSAALPPGSSAVFMLVPRRALQPVLDEVGCFGGRAFQAPIDLTAASWLRGASSNQTWAGTGPGRRRSRRLPPDGTERQRRAGSGALMECPDALHPGTL